MKKIKHLLQNNKEWITFSEAFPSVAMFVEKLNKGYCTVKKGKGKLKAKAGDRKCTYAYITQSIEAYLLLDIIVKKIKSLNPNIPLVTLHDGIFTIPEYSEAVRDIMIAVYEQHVGFVPDIKLN